MEICYGITVLEHNNPYVSIAKAAIEGVSVAGSPEAFLVDLFPVLKYVPSWFPGAGFKRKAARWRVIIYEMLERLYRRVKRDLVSTNALLLRRGTSLMREFIVHLGHGNARPSVLQSMISKLPDESDPKRGEAEMMARAVTAVVYGGKSLNFSPFTF